MIVFELTCASRTSFLSFLAPKAASKKMVVLSIQVCIGIKVVKDWGLHPIIKHSTLEDIFKRLQSSKLEGASRVSLEIPDNADVGTKVIK